MKNQFVPINLKPFDVEGIKDVALPQGFPNCCELHTDSFNQIQNWVQNNFPNCCEYHKESFTGENKNKLEHYNLNNIPLKVWQNYYKTLEHINTVFNSNKEDWANDIFDYIQYCQLSFGLPSIGGHYYFTLLENSLKYNVQEVKTLTKIEREKLTGILKRFDKDKSDRLIEHTYIKADYSKLLQTYQKWYKTFPFTIKGLPKNPFIISKYRTNRYTKLKYYTPIGQRELLLLLFELTRTILYKLNLKEYIEKESNEKVEQLNKHLIIKNFDLEQEQMMDAFNRNEIKYVTVLRQWLDRSKKLIDSLKPSISNKEIKIETPKEYNTQIFKTAEAQTWFFNTLEELNALDQSRTPKRGFQARISAIFNDKDCKESIFRFELLLKEFVAFINNEFDNCIKNDKQLSDGTKYSKKVAELVKLHIERLK